MVKKVGSARYGGGMAKNGGAATRRRGEFSAVGWANGLTRAVDQIDGRRAIPLRGGRGFGNGTTAVHWRGVPITVGSRRSAIRRPPCRSTARRNGPPERHDRRWIAVRAIRRLAAIPAKNGIYMFLNQCLNNFLIVFNSFFRFLFSF